MTIITGLLRLVHRIARILGRRTVGALCAHIEAVRWRCRVLRSLDQRRRG